MATHLVRGDSRSVGFQKLYCPIILKSGVYPNRAFRSLCVNPLLSHTHAEHTPGCSLSCVARLALAPLGFLMSAPGPCTSVGPFPVV